MKLTNELHLTFLYQISTLVQTIERAIIDKKLNEYNIYDYEKQYNELRNSLLKIEEYKDVYPLFNLEKVIPAKSKSILSFLLKPSWKYRSKYEKECEEYLIEMTGNLRNAHLYMVEMKINIGLLT
jgi:hypothetical protein